METILPAAIATLVTVCAVVLLGVWARAFWEAKDTEITTEERKRDGG